MSSVKLGIYEHYKGKRYEVLAVGRDSETLKDVVIYKALYNSTEFGNQALWVRPLDIFCENVVVDGIDTPRFSYINKASSKSRSKGATL